VNTISASGRGHISSIVYQEFRRTAARKLSRARDEFIQYSCCQGFFADLNQIDFCNNRGSDKLEDVLEAFTICGRR